MKRTRTQKQRLLKWADRLRHIKTSKTQLFDMNDWYYEIFKDPDLGFTEFPVEPDKPCGFAACAVGWLPMMFNEFSHWKGGFPSEVQVRTYFGLSPTEFEVITMPGSYAGDRCREIGDLKVSTIKPSTVAKRIEEVVAGEYEEDDDDNE